MKARRAESEIRPTWARRPGPRTAEYVRSRGLGALFVEAAVPGFPVVLAVRRSVGLFGSEPVGLLWLWRRRDELFEFVKFVEVREEFLSGRGDAVEA